MFRRFSDKPLIRPEDIKPFDDRFEVVGVFNPGVTEINGEILLLLRVAVRPKQDDHFLRVPVLRDGKIETLQLDKSELDCSDERVLDLLKSACMTEREVLDYIGGQFNRDTYFWHISDLKIYDKPKELREFRTWRFGKNDGCETCFNKKWWEGDTADENLAKRICAPCQKDNFRKQITRPPQSWCYVEEI